MGTVTTTNHPLRKEVVRTPTPFSIPTTKKMFANNASSAAFVQNPTRVVDGRRIQHQQKRSTTNKTAADFGTPAYEKMVKTCIKQDLTWKEPAEKWEALLEELAFGTEESAKKAEVIEPEKLASGIAATTA